MLKKVQIHKERAGLQEVRSLSAIHIHGSAVATMGEQRDGLCCLKVLFASFDCAVSITHINLTYTHSSATQTLLTLEL